jgi:hypothetical protein
VTGSVALGVALSVALGVALGCSHDARPVVQPDEHPPLPPGTPIGLLIDDASELQLRDDQLTTLKTIDTDLAGQLDGLDARQRGAGHAPVAAAQPAASGRHRGGRRGGGGMQRGRNAGAGAGSAMVAASSPAPSPPGSSTAAGGADDRAADVRAAIERAFAVFDPVQRVIARRVLTEHGVDVDAGRSGSAPTEATPDEAEDPDAGSGGN